MYKAIIKIVLCTTDQSCISIGVQFFIRRSLRLPFTWYMILPTFSFPFPPSFSLSRFPFSPSNDLQGEKTVWDSHIESVDQVNMHKTWNCPTDCVSTLPHHCCCLPLPPPPPPGTTTISGAPLMTSRCTKPPTSSHRCSGSSGCPSPWRLPPALSPPLHWLVKILRLELSRERPPGSTPPTLSQSTPQVWRGIAFTICDSRN